MNQLTLKKLIHYNPDTGEFTRLVRSSHNAGCGDIPKSGYRRIHIQGKRYLAHRIAWMYMFGRFPINEIDHINGNRADNRLINLREVSRKENAKNLKMQTNNTSGIQGVRFDADRMRWLARIKINSVTKNLGRFDDKFDAICARKSAEHKYGFHVNHGRMA